jgi:cation transport regulator
MPYKSNEDLPENIQKLPSKAQTMFRQTFNTSLTKYDEETAFKVAWSIVKSKFKKVGGKWVAKGMGHGLFTFEMVNKSDSFIRKADDGEYYLEAVLSDTEPDLVGTRFTEATLKDYAEQINKFGIGGFLTHQDWDDFCMSNSHLDEQAFVARARTERKGIFKKVKAIFHEGKLWIKALLDKRYINQAQKFNKVSIEALVPERFRTNGEFKGGYVLGVALANKAINPRAEATIKHEQS